MSSNKETEIEGNVDPITLLPLDRKKRDEIFNQRQARKRNRARRKNYIKSHPPKNDVNKNA